MTNETTSCINLEPHNGVIVKREWQEREPVDGMRLCFSEEILVCARCGQVLQDWQVKP